MSKPILAAQRPDGAIFPPYANDPPREGWKMVLVAGGQVVGDALAPKKSPSPILNKDDLSMEAASGPQADQQPAQPIVAQQPLEQPPVFPEPTAEIESEPDPPFAAMVKSDLIDYAIEHDIEHDGRWSEERLREHILKQAK